MNDKISAGRFRGYLKAAIEMEEKKFGELKGRLEVYKELLEYVNKVEKDTTND